MTGLALDVEPRTLVFEQFARDFEAYAESLGELLSAVRTIKPGEFEERWNEALLREGFSFFGSISRDEAGIQKRFSP